MDDLSALSFLEPHYRWACQERRLHSFTKEKIKAFKNTKRYDFGTKQQYITPKLSKTEWWSFPRRKVRSVLG